MIELPDLDDETAPATLQRARGTGLVRVRMADGQARLERLYQEGSAKIRLPRDPDAQGVEAVLINTAGGLTDGDRLAWRAEARAGARLTLTTQACEKVYRSRGGHAEVGVALTAGEGARIDWLPQETILFDRGALRRRLDVDLAPGARLLAVEAVVLGRTAMGESVHKGALRDRWRVRRDGRLIFADEICLEGDIAGLSAQAPLLAGGCAFASLLLVCDEAERCLTPVRAALGAAGGASAFDGKLTARVTAADGLALRRALIPALEALRGARLPRVWRL